MATAQSQSADLRSLGNDAFRCGRWADAEAAYTAALELLPPGVVDHHDHVTLLTNRAAAWLKLGRAADARKDANAAVALDPTAAKAWYRLAAAALEEGDVAAARSAAARLRSLSGTSADTQELLQRIARAAPPPTATTAAAARGVSTGATTAIPAVGAGATGAATTSTASSAVPPGEAMALTRTTRCSSGSPRGAVALAGCPATTAAMGPTPPTPP